LGSRSRLRSQCLPTRIVQHGRSPAGGGKQGSAEIGQCKRGEHATHSTNDSPRPQLQRMESKELTRWKLSPHAPVWLHPCILGPCPDRASQMLGQAGACCPRTAPESSTLPDRAASPTSGRRVANPSCSPDALPGANMSRSLAIGLISRIEESVHEGSRQVLPDYIETRSRPVPPDRLTGTPGSRIRARPISGVSRAIGRGCTWPYVWVACELLF